MADDMKATEDNHLFLVAGIAIVILLGVGAWRIWSTPTSMTVPRESDRPTLTERDYISPPIGEQPTMDSAARTYDELYDAAKSPSPEMAINNTGTVAIGVDACSDTDGDDPSVLGTVQQSFSNANFTINTFTDTCATSYRLIEWICEQTPDNRNIAKGVFHRCTTGCYDGACSRHRSEGSATLEVGGEGMAYSIDNVDARITPRTPIMVMWESNNTKGCQTHGSHVLSIDGTPWPNQEIPTSGETVLYAYDDKYRTDSIVLGVNCLSEDGKVVGDEMQIYLR